MSLGRIVGIVQARTGSRRFPRKVLAPIKGISLLWVLLQRVRASQSLDAIVVATTELPQDDAVANGAAEAGVLVFRGSEMDCLDRYWRAAEWAGADTVVRLTGDNPLVDGTIIDEAIDSFRVSGCDYLSTALNRSYPIGLAVEVFSRQTLHRTWQDARDPRHREHVTLYMYELPGRFATVALDNGPGDQGLRWTVDTEEDLKTVQTIFERFPNFTFSWRDALPIPDLGPARGGQLRQDEVAE